MSKLKINTQIRAIFKRFVVNVHIQGEIDIVPEPDDEADDLDDEPGEYDPDYPDD